MSAPVPATSLRPAEARDAGAIDAIEQASFDQHGERFSLRYIRYLIQSRRADVVVAEREGNVVGWAAGFVWSRSEIPWGRIYAVATAPQARGAGIGRRLTQWIIEVLTARGAVRLFLEVRADNVAALGLYQKLGFHTCRTLPHYYGAGVSAVRMARNVSESRRPGRE